MSSQATCPVAESSIGVVALLGAAVLGLAPTPVAAARRTVALVSKNAIGDRRRTRESSSSRSEATWDAPASSSGRDGSRPLHIASRVMPRAVTTAFGRGCPTTSSCTAGTVRPPVG